jgi:biopolymer transport protein ExbB
MGLMGMFRRTSDARSRAAGRVGMLLGLAFITLWPVSARAWWNDEWALRKKITIDTSSAGAAVTDPIGATPVLVRLHVGNFRFGSAKEDGSDLRFVSGDDKTPLKHHIEKYDSLLGEALVWVGVPDLKPGAKTELWLYYANRKVAAANDAKGTYDPDTLTVYHFNERGTPALDSSAWANTAQSAGQAADGAIIGQGLRLDGANAVTLPASPSLAVAENGAFTWSAWIKMAAPQPNAAIYSRRDGANEFVIGLDSGVPFVEITNAAGTQRSTAGVPVAANSWRHLAVAANGTQVTLYLDGSPYATVNASLPALNTIALIGGRTAQATAVQAATPSQPAAPQSDTSPGDRAALGGDAAATAESAPPVAAAPPVAVAPSATGFAGDIDEMQIAKTARPAGFIKAAAIGQGPDHAKLVSFSVDEETSSWLTGYFAVILKSVTLDGWVVIGILMIIAVISWIVMIDKAAYLRRQRMANAQFLKTFRDVEDDLTALDRPDDQTSVRVPGPGDIGRKLAKHSSLYRVYHIGAQEIRRRFSVPGSAKVLSAPSIAAIRAALDSGFVQEAQRLNRQMVVLTIAISGGPFLGLLGTVVGVMITFAAIAASGDVNVNAIAPGIAAALVATVAGLAVAIPALFAYNFLITGIKNLTTDLQVFVDEFVTKMAEFYSEQPMPHRIAAE